MSDADDRNDHSTGNDNGTDPPNGGPNLDAMSATLYLAEVNGIAFH